MRRITRLRRLSPMLLLIVAASALPGHAERAPGRKAEKATPIRIAAQSLGGLGMGALGALAGMGLGGVVGKAALDCEECIDGAYVGAFIGAYAGYTAGTVAGISWVGHKQGLRGSAWATVAGNLAGQALAFWLKEQVGGGAGQIALVLGAPAALSLAAYDGSHWARSRMAPDGTGNRPEPGLQGSKAWRLELARINF